METLGLTQKIMPKMPKIACNWSSWANKMQKTNPTNDTFLNMGRPSIGRLRGGDATALEIVRRISERQMTSLVTEPPQGGDTNDVLICVEGRAKVSDKDYTGGRGSTKENWGVQVWFSNLRLPLLLVQFSLSPSKHKAYLLLGKFARLDCSLLDSRPVYPELPRSSHRFHST